MKLRLLLALASSLALSAAAAVPIFNATLSMGKDNRFVLISPEGKTSQFLKLGDVFGDYTLKAYDAKTTTLDLEQNGKIVRVVLVGDSGVGNAPADAQHATLADAEVVLNKMHFEEMIGRSLERQKKAMTASMEQMTARMGSMPGMDKDAALAFRQKVMDETLSIMEPKQLKDDVTKIYSDVFTKEELDSMSAFYSTPLGETLANKQPEVQDKLGAIIQGRMMAMMPKIQQMAKDFATEQKAKMAEARAAGTLPAPAPIPTPKP
jgi:hypothetical protein